MAKWGEGDPRWIVEERPDATNVNNWHWTERDASSWSKERLKNLFDGFEIKSEIAELKTDVEKCDGEASANCRKGKLIFFYEWNLVLKWEGSIKEGSGAKYVGNVTIPNLSEENEIRDLDIQVTIKDNEGEGEVLKEIMLNVGKDVIRQRVAEYIESLKQEFSKGMILPKKENVKQDQIKTLSSGFNKKMTMEPVSSKNAKSTKEKINTSTVTIKEKFQCTADDVYKTFTIVERVQAFTRGPVKLEPVVGGLFELFGGNISGIFVELVPSHKIVQRWRYKQWPADHHSTVTLTISQKDDHTEVNLVQTGVPSGDADVTKQNWDRYYWNSIKQTFGFGAFLP